MEATTPELGPVRFWSPKSLCEFVKYIKEFCEVPSAVATPL